MTSTMGRRIRKRRTALGLSQEAVAQACGVTRASVSQWEKGETVMSGPNLVALARVLETPESVIITGHYPQDKAADPAGMTHLEDRLIAVISEAMTALGILPASARRRRLLRQISALLDRYRARS